MGYNVFFEQIKVEIDDSLYELYFNDLMNMKYEDFHNNKLSFENKTEGYYNIEFLKETLCYFSNKENYEKCAELIKLKNKFNIEF
jgi:hypothetical protein